MFLLYLKNLLSYTARHNYFHSLFLPFKSLPATYLYSVCTQSLRIVIAQCHSAAKRRGLLPFGGRFVAEIFFNNFTMIGVSERGRPKLYYDPNVVTVSQELAELYSST